jgi:N-acetylmuramoyl-L-alanine amidase
VTAFEPDHAGAVCRPSPNFGPRAADMRPEMVILHYTGMATGQGAEDWLCDPRSEVSSHYLVHEDGRVVQMVREADRAWHAGKSFWRGVTDINSQSVGIEIVNPGHGLGYPAFPARQIRSVVTLCADIVARQGTNPAMVLAHSDVAPGRKVDPGEKFPWDILARAGLGDHVPASRARRGTSLVAGDEGQGVTDLQSLLARYGYGIDITGVFDPRTVAVVEAFQRHFRRRSVDGVADASTVQTLERLVARLPL